MIREDSVSGELAGCECTFFAWCSHWRVSLLPDEQGGSPLRSPAPGSHPKFCAGEGEESKYQAAVDGIILVSRS